MRHLTRLADIGPAGAASLIERARTIKRASPPPRFAGKILVLFFLAPSLRTRVSFQVAMLRAGGSAVVVEAGSGIWPLETRPLAVMNEDRVEHLEEAVGVLGRYGDALAVRAFATLESDPVDLEDPLVSACRDHSPVPVISMESAAEHPAQGLADLMTVIEAHGSPRGLPVMLRWAPHVKPLPKAVPHSFLLTAAALGCRVTVAAPEGFELPQAVLNQAREWARRGGGDVTTVHDPRALADRQAAFCVKSWGAAGFPATHPVAGRHADWMVDADWLALTPPDCILLHCLPLRRNVEIAQDVLKSPRCRIFDEAQNRIFVQQSALEWLWGLRP
jgi:N-acetylornithine carbamoyltransferase